MTKEERKAREDNWKFRRVAVFLSLGSMLTMMSYLTVFADGNNAVQAMLAQSIPVGVIGTLITYIGGPIADDFVQFKVNKS